MKYSEFKNEKLVVVAGRIPGTYTNTHLQLFNVPKDEILAYAMRHTYTGVEVYDGSTFKTLK